MHFTPVVIGALAVLLAWITPVLAEAPPHPLIGKILDTRTGALTELTDPATVRALFPCGAITLLGEVHDNPDHHNLRAVLVRMQPAAAGDAPAKCGPGGIVFEHISVDQQPALDQFLALGRLPNQRATAGTLFRLLKWDKSGWPDQRIFRALITQVARSGRKIYAGHPSKASLIRVAREGLGQVPPEQVRRLYLDQTLSPPLQSALMAELNASHCGHPASDNMAHAQRYRDAYMADVSLQAATERGSAIMFVGNGHVRADRGIPWYIRQRAPDRPIVSVAFAEIEQALVDPTRYGPRDPAGRPATDFVAFATPADRVDPCVELRALMSKAKQ